MDPPSYTATAIAAGAVPAPRSVQDTRTLILGNANIIRPRTNNEPVELLVSKRKLPRASAEEAARELHYAYLVTKVKGKQEIDILLKGPARDTIEEALDEMLERTELLVEEMLKSHGLVMKAQWCCSPCMKLWARERERERQQS